MGPIKSAEPLNFFMQTIHQHSEMRLLAHDLQDADLAQVARFLRDGRHRWRMAWSLVFEGDAEVIIFSDDDDCPTVPGMLEPPLATLRIGRTHDRSHLHGSPGWLQRPLDYECFVKALLSIESLPGRAYDLGAIADRPVPRTHS
jgi:hypothetical protein